MSTEDNKQVVLESFRVLETGDAAVADRIVAPDFINREADEIPIALIGESEARQV